MKTKAVRRPPEKDFKKKVAKVGRKVKKSNASDIHVQSKTIYLPTQNLENNKSETVKDKLQRISKQLHHYSSPHRLAALNELSDLISLYTNTEISNGKDNDDDNASSFTNSISLILPESFELFFDEEEKIRLATVELLAKAMAKFSTATLMSVVPVAVTYVCSGLTHISKVIALRCSMLLCPLWSLLL